MLKLILEKISKKGFKYLDLDIKKLTTKIKADVWKLGLATPNKMKDVIKKSKVRPQAGEPTELEDSISVDFFGNKGWGVGNLLKLPIYWKAFNWGSFHMVGKHLPKGAFAPGNPKPDSSNFRDGRFKKGTGSFSPIVKKPILPTNFLEKTHFWVASELAKLHKRILANLKGK